MALVLAAALILALPASAAAEAPADVAALPYREACRLDDTRVDVPLAEMPDYLHDDWGLPDTEDHEAWSATSLVLLGRAFEQGRLSGVAEPRAAARVYCLALRRDGAPLAAALLSRLHARGDGVALSPGLARHLARIAALELTPAYWLEFQRTVPEALETPGRTVEIQLERAAAWHARMKELTGSEIAKLEGRYRHGRGVPVSHKLSDALLTYGVRESPELAMRYVRHMLETHPDEVRHRLTVRHLTLVQLHRAAKTFDRPDAQHLLGRILLAGEVVPRIRRLPSCSSRRRSARARRSRSTSTG